MPAGGSDERRPTTPGPDPETTPDATVLMVFAAQEGAHQDEQTELCDRSECRLQGHGSDDVGGDQNFQPQ